jgi:hypothetical protein
VLSDGQGRQSRCRRVQATDGRGAGLAGGGGSKQGTSTCGKRRLCTTAFRDHQPPICSTDAQRLTVILPSGHLTSRRSLVRAQYRPLSKELGTPASGVWRGQRLTEDPGQSEALEDVGVSEPCDRGDLVALEGQYEERVGARNIGAWSLEVAAKCGLSICARRDQSKRCVAALRRAA